MTAILSAVIAGLVAIIVALVTTRVETRSQATQLRHEIDLQEQRLRTELRTEYMAEEAINQLLRKAQPKRTFHAIAARVGGFSDDELRRLLVRAGALRFGRASDGTELWGLRDRNEADV